MPDARPVTGPAARPVVRLVDLRSTPLDVLEVIDAVDDESAGGVDVFIGRVRDHDSERGVVALDYTAHPSALERLREVCETIASAHEVRAIAAVHRTGPLAVGDLAVVVAAAADHRDQAFTAARALIDTLKAEVPIWKHQQFGDGDQEWVGAPGC